MSKYAPWTMGECEAGVHEPDQPCTDECVRRAYEMDGSGYSESMIYSDYLGGTSSVDVSGCHGGPPMPEQQYRLDGGKVVAFYAHPEDCQCGEDECPAMIAYRAEIAGVT